MSQGKENHYYMSCRVYKCKNHVGMTPCQKLLKQEGTVRRIESIQQSSATPKNHDVGRGLRKIVVCSQSSSQCLLVSCEAIVFPLVHMRMRLIKREYACACIEGSGNQTRF